MHQHLRSPAPTAPTSSPRPRPQDQDLRSNSPAFDLRTHPNRGLGIETETDSADSGPNLQPGKDAITKLNQVVTNYYTKAALIILHSRVELPPVYNKGSARVNRWFNIEIEDTDVIRDQLKIWRSSDAIENRPPPLIIETYLDTKGLTNSQTLVVLDENGKRWDVLESLAASQGSRSVKPPSGADDVILERWRVELGDMPGKLPSDLNSILPTVYKKSIVVFRTLFTYSKVLPAWKFFKRNGRFRANPALRIKYRILDGHSAQESSKPDRLTAPLYEGDDKVVDTYSFGVTESPAGPFSLQVTYRTSCDFRIDDSEALLSSRFMGADDEIFRPSLPSQGFDGKATNPEVGSAPVDRRTVEDPDPGLAYGSLSTFHHVAPLTGASPISALRAAREAGASSPSPPKPSDRKPLTAARASPAGRAAILASERTHDVVRRPSISFQPFKAPPLSASPSLVDPPLGASPRTAGAVRTSGAEFKNNQVAPARKSLSSAPDNPIASSNSASPRPAPISRYSSAFSHRRGRPSTGGVNKVEDDHSSGRASATSSGAQPGSGLLAEITGTSADSLHADDENISEFLKMLDLRKDLLNTSSYAALDTLARRTTATSAALSRFQRMRDSNAALSDSMSSSLLLQRSSNSSSKQLSGVPPMVAGASVSTASSPGKPISPHTPHTPAIPSRLSSNSIVDDNNDLRTATRSVPRDDNSSPPDENTSDETAVGHHPSRVTAIPIPTSPPALFPSTFRRSSSAANGRSTTPVDDEEIFNMRSVSLGAEEPSHTTLGALQRRHAYEGAEANVAPSGPVKRHSGSDTATVLPGPTTREFAPNRGALASGRIAGSSPSSNHPLHQRHFSHSRGRGFSGGPHSLSSGSSSVARGGLVPSYFAERDQEREISVSGSNSGTSATEDRQVGRRSSAGRISFPQPAQLEEDEPLLFAMSDFGASRRSFEEGRHGNHGADTSGNTSGSRRGSGRRGGLSNFHVWS